MNEVTKVAVPNYSEAQVLAISEPENMDWASAKIIGLAIGKSPQSVVSKRKSLELAYTPKPPPRKKAIQATKVELVAQIQNLIDRDLAGLEKSSRQAILNCLSGVQHLIPPKVEPALPEIGDSD